MDRKITEQILWEIGEYLRAEEKSEATVRKYVRAVQELGDFLEGAQMDKGKLLEYRSMLVETCRPQTVNGRLAAIHMFLKWIGHSEWRIRFLKEQKQEQETIQELETEEKTSRGEKQKITVRLLFRNRRK